MAFSSRTKRTTLGSDRSSFIESIFGASRPRHLRSNAAGYTASEFLWNMSSRREPKWTSLAFHIVFAALGVGLPLLVFAAEGLWLRTHDRAYYELARAWTKGMAILFAVGAVSG